MKNLGIIGWPLNKSLSPFLHSRFLVQTAINGGYTSFEIKESMELPILMHFLERFGFTGLNVTSPHKQAILSYVQDVDDTVRFLKAANTLTFTKNGWKAHNTDSYGFGRQLDISGIEPAGKNILIFGAGGAARAVALACYERGAVEFTVVNRNSESVEQMRADFSGMVINYTSFEDLKEENFFDILINTATIDWSNSIWLNKFWAGKEKIFSPAVVIDLQYMPRNTPFMNLFHDSEKYNGFTMLVEQAARAFEIWCGVMPEYSLKELEGAAYSVSE
ncbi:MAG: hypothetical protein LBH05_01145 [Deferribacteraceae bacterium]|nr:hypothetical protein [Deferribacteraceae bacterium]